MQAERAKASMESTGKSRSSNEESSERLDSEGGAGSSNRPTHRRKRRRGQRRNKRSHEDSPNLEIPLTIAEEASGDDDEPPKKRSQEEKISSDDDDLVMPEVLVNEVVTDPVVAFEEEPRDSGVDPESSPSDLPQDSDNFEPSIDATFDDASDEFMEAESIQPVVEEGCDSIGKVPLSFSGPEQGVLAVDPGVGASSTSFDEVKVSPRVDIPYPVAPIGKSLLITLPTVYDMGSRPTEHGESSSGPSLQFTKKVLKRVLSSWIETLSSGHLEAGFGMIKHVQDILADSEKVGLDITNAKAYVDEVIALGNK
ncbi:hypothetical protein MRB53_002232 [Persea americana]|uniref:Uncharacterized protein n=1 Tax=Persea americana TaxID=3435 RepID=A0ACC2MU08_PERAE|nr:hypothetical protein MRB53_002232 [Persea americana]